MSRWSFLPDDDPYRGPPSVGFLQVQEGLPYQVWLTWNSWNFSWVTFLKESELARSIVDDLADRLQNMSKDISDEGLRHLEAYLEEITAQSEFPIPQEMDEKIHEDLRQRHGGVCGLRVAWPFSEPPLRKSNATFLGIWSAPQGTSGVWITMDAGNTFFWIAFYTVALDAHWACLAVEQAIKRGGFVTTERAEAVLLEAVNRSESPVPSDMDEDIQSAIREDFEARHETSRWESPKYSRDISVFRLFYESSRRQIEATMQSMQLAQRAGEFADEGYDPYLLQELCAMQRMYCLDHTHMYYLEPSGLKMCEALSSPASEPPDFPTEPLWIQPLAPLPFRKGLVRGMFLYDSYNRERINLLPLSDPRKQERARYYSERKHGVHQIEMFYDNPENRTKLWQGKTLLFGEYDTRSQTWNRMAEGHECLSGNCVVEPLGDQDILLQCEECQKEFAHWTQWFEVFFLEIQGKLRSVDDTTRFDELELPFECGKQQKGKGQSRKSRRYHATVVRFDASYFRPTKRRGKRGSLQDSHIVLTTEEALKEGVLDLDMDGVLIRDTTPRTSFTRHLVHPRFKKSEAYVKFKEAMPQLVSLATWKARRVDREKTAHRQTDVYASEYEEQEGKDKKSHPGSVD